MKKIIKRAASLLLAAALTISFMPFAAAEQVYAEGEAPVRTVIIDPGAIGGEQIVRSSTDEGMLAPAGTLQQKGQFQWDGTYMWYRYPDLPESFAAPEGYVFKGWTSSAWEPLEDPGYCVVVNESDTVTLTAQWEETTPPVAEAKTYAKYDSSNRTLTFFNSTDSYTNGQIDGTVTYYADFVDTEFEFGHLPWDAVKEDVKTVTFEDVIKPVSTRSWFDTFKNLETINNIENLDTSNVTSMRSMFYDCNSLASLDLSTLDTSKVTTMMSMFRGCTAFTSLDLSGFDTSNVEDMSNMFAQCEGLTSLDLSGFSTAKVTTMKFMFYKCYGLTSIDLSGFDTSHVTTMAGMFEDCKNLKSIDVSDFVTSVVTDMSYMFCGAEALKRLDLTAFDTAGVTTMEWMFARASELELVDLSSFNISAVTDMAKMFQGCSKLSVIIVDPTIWDASGIDHEHSSSMFFGAESLPGYENLAASVDASKAILVEEGGYLMTKPVSIEGATVTGISNKTYTGKALTQSPVVTLGGRTLESNVDYSVSYANNTNVGTASVMITGMGIYTGTITKTFTISEIRDLPAVTITKPKVGKKKMTIKWKKVSKKNQKKIQGIQIQIATDANFKNIVKTKKVGKTKTSWTCKGLKSKTRYYVRIRAYKSGNHVSAWKSKNAKVK